MDQILSFLFDLANYCETVNEYNYLFQELMAFVKREDVAYFLGEALAYFLDKYITPTWIPNHLKICLFTCLYVCHLKKYILCI